MYTLIKVDASTNLQFLYTTLGDYGNIKQHFFIPRFLVTYLL